MRYHDKNTTKNKLKDEFVTAPARWWWYSSCIGDGSGFEISYYARGLYCHRQIRTTQERRNYFLTEDEIECGVRLRARRSFKMLPCAWEDVPVAAHDESKSWKRNSKRAKQWKYE